MSTWKKRTELPVFKKLKQFQFDPIQLVEAYEEFSNTKTWDGLGNEYASLCETYTRLPKMFFKEQELKDVDRVCDIEWQEASYQQLSLVEWDDSFTLDKRVEKSGTRWDTTVAKRNPKVNFN